MAKAKNPIPPTSPANGERDAYIYNPPPIPAIKPEIETAIHWYL
jgi:hypothetical protein